LPGQLLFAGLRQMVLLQRASIRVTGVVIAIEAYTGLADVIAMKIRSKILAAASLPGRSPINPDLVSAANPNTPGPWADRARPMQGRQRISDCVPGSASNTVAGQWIFFQLGVGNTGQAGSTAIAARQ